ncbi:MAG: 50S ribosomal protein L4 [Deltaproteobacteria bacterium]|nr:50S ribosomal protein L4 [Deltaproteobacteria bacterium]
MPNFDVYNKDGQKVSEVTLSEDIFGSEVKQHVMWLVVKGQLAAKRAGTHKAKTRTEVRGGGKKPYKQKGTGWARQGSSRAPNHVGGGRAHGPKPRSYALSIPKRTRRVALISALSLKASEKKIYIIDDLNMGSIKTKNMAAMISNFNAKKALIIESKENKEVVLSTRNLEKHKWLPPEAVNVYDILKHDTLIMNVSVAQELDSRLAKPVR